MQSYARNIWKEHRHVKFAEKDRRPRYIISQGELGRDCAMLGLSLRLVFCAIAVSTITLLGRVIWGIW